MIIIDHKIIHNVWTKILTKQRVKCFGGGMTPLISLPESRLCHVMSFKSQIVALWFNTSTSGFARVYVFICTRQTRTFTSVLV